LCHTGLKNVEKTPNFRRRKYSLASGTVFSRIVFKIGERRRETSTSARHLKRTDLGVPMPLHRKLSEEDYSEDLSNGY